MKYSKMDRLSKEIWKIASSTNEIGETYQDSPLSLVVTKQKETAQNVSDSLKNNFSSTYCVDKITETNKISGNFKLAPVPDIFPNKITNQDTRKDADLHLDTRNSVHDLNNDKLNEVSKQSTKTNSFTNYFTEKTPNSIDSNKYDSIKNTNTNDTIFYHNKEASKSMEEPYKRERSDSIEEIKPYDPFEGLDNFKDIEVKHEKVEIKYESDTEQDHKNEETQDKCYVNIPIEFNLTNNVVNDEINIAQEDDDREYIDDEYHSTGDLQMLLDDTLESSERNGDAVASTSKKKKKKSSGEFEIPIAGSSRKRKHDPASIKKKKKRACKLCDKRFEKASALKRHMVDSHDGLFECDGCSAKCGSWKEMELHKRREHGESNWDEKENAKKRLEEITEQENFCDLCHLDFDSPHYFSIHNLRVHNMFRKDLEFACQHCEMSYKNKNSLRVHMIRKHQPEIKVRLRCDFCDKIYHKKNSLSVHIKRCHLEESADLTTFLKCSMCRYKFGNQIKLDYHMSRAHKIDPPEFVHNCTICGLKFDSKKILNYHVTKKHMVSPKAKACFRCKHCGKTYDKRDTYTLHVQRTHLKGSKDVEAAETFDCDMCEKSFTSKETYKKHVSKMHESKLKKDSADDLKKDCFQCHNCDAMFTDKNLLLRHLQVDHGEKPTFFECDECEKYFTTKKNLLRHQNDIHSGLTYTCDVCKRDFISRTSWRVHMRRHLESMGPVDKTDSDGPKVKSSDVLKCPECEKVFTTTACSAWEKLRIHMRRHIGKVKREKSEEDDAVICQHCGETFTRTQFTRHIWLKHRETKTGPYKCDSCKFVTARKEGITKHVQIHMRNSLFECNYNGCTYKSMWLKRFNKHMQKHNPELSCEFCKFKTKNRDTLINHVLEHGTGEKRFKCSVCTFKTNSEDGFKKHNAKHTLPKLQCKFCDHKAVSYFLLYKHLKIIHNKTSAKLSKSP